MGIITSPERHYSENIHQNLLTRFQANPLAFGDCATNAAAARLVNFRGRKQVQFDKEVHDFHANMLIEVECMKTAADVLKAKFSEQLS